MEMTDTEIARRIADLPPEKRALLFQQLQQQRAKEPAAAAQRIPRVSRDRETYPLSFAQQRLWFLNNFEPESPEHNIPQAFRTGGREYLLYYNVHHIAYDGWSMGIFARELAAIYDAFAAGIPSPLPELQVQYLDFALWQRDWLSGEVLARQLAYWRRQLASVPPLELPTYRPRPAVRTHHGAALPLGLGDRLPHDLKIFAQREGSTIFIVLMAAFQALLYHGT